MENASEPEAPRMSIQTKDLIRYTNHTIHQRKNHAKPIQKFHHNSTHSQSTTKHLDTLPADSEAPRPTPFPSNHKETQPFLPAIQRSADGSSNSRESTQSSSPHQSPLPPVAPHTHHYLPPGIEQPGRRVPVGSGLRRGLASRLPEFC